MKKFHIKLSELVGNATTVFLTTAGSLIFVYILHKQHELYRITLKLVIN